MQPAAVQAKHPVFVSLPQYELHVPHGLAEPGGKHWRVVEIPLHAPWFLLTVEHEDPDRGGFGISSTLCIAWELDLAQAIKAVEVERVRGLVAMMPGWASSTGQWWSRQIAEVWLEADDTGRCVTLVDDAGRAFDAAMQREPAMRRDSSELLLRLPKNKSRA